MPDTIYASFAESAQHNAARTALMHKVNGEYRDTSYAELSRAVNEVAAGLAERGVRPGDRVGIYSYNRPEWVVTDLAIIKLGAVVVPIYHTLPADSVRYILRDAAVGHLVVENAELFTAVASVMQDCPELKDVITLFPREGESRTGKELFSFDSLRRSGTEALARRPDAVRPHPARREDLVTIVYTSGTTGEPKGAMLSHGNILSNVQAAIPSFKINPADMLVSFLPLCHMFERTCGYYTMLLAGGCIAYAESLQTIRDDVARVRPTIMIVVPRVLEKVYNAVAEKVMTGPALSRFLMLATLRAFGHYAQNKARGTRQPLLLRLRRWLLGRLVVSKLKKLGGGRLRLLVSGGAPLDRKLARVVRSLGFNLLEGYGLTETSPIVCAAVPGQERVGTVGKPFPGVEVRIGTQEEVLVRGPNVMQGYLNKPEETAKSIDKEGWFHTGDQGRFDDEGNLIITGRIKEIIVNSYGKNIAPVPLELAIAGSKYIEQVVVVGDRQPYLTALVVPGRLTLIDYCREHGIPTDDYAAALLDERVIALFRSVIDDALKGQAGYEQVKRFRLVPEPFTVENGLLTPSLKVRRPLVTETYKHDIAAMYREV